MKLTSIGFVLFIAPRLLIAGGPIKASSDWESENSTIAELQDDLDLSQNFNHIIATADSGYIWARAAAAHSTTITNSSSISKRPVMSSTTSKPKAASNTTSKTTSKTTKFTHLSPGPVKSSHNSIYITPAAGTAHRATTGVTHGNTHTHLRSSKANTSSSTSYSSRKKTAASGASTSSPFCNGSAYTTGPYSSGISYTLATFSSEAPMLTSSFNYGNRHAYNLKNNTCQDLVNLNFSEQWAAVDGDNMVEIFHTMCSANQLFCLDCFGVSKDRCKSNSLDCRKGLRDLARPELANGSGSSR